MPRMKQQPKKVDIEPLVEDALKSKAELKRHIESLGGSSRRERQTSASVIYQVAKNDVSLVEPYVNEIVDAMNRPEGQTRAEALMTLTLLIPTNSRECMKAIEPAEDALFDETSGPLRLSAFIFLCDLGSTTALRSKEVWPLIDEALQCYHGDIEFPDMLEALARFSKGKLNPQVKEELAERLSFDAENASGKLQTTCQDIISNLKLRKK